MQIQVSWLLQKPTDLDLHCLQNRVYPGSAGQELKCVFVEKYKNFLVEKSALSGTIYLAPYLELFIFLVKSFIKIGEEKK